MGVLPSQVILWVQFVPSIMIGICLSSTETGEESDQHEITTEEDLQSVLSSQCIQETGSCSRFQQHLHRLQVCIHSGNLKLCSR